MKQSKDAIVKFSTFVPYLVHILKKYNNEDSDKPRI